LENCGKELWMTEVYVPNSDNNSADRFPEAVQVAENMHNGLVVANLSAYVWWYIRRQYGPMKEDGQISKRGYMMAQYSKWVRPGAVRIGATEQPNNNILCSAYQNEDGSIAVVAINKGSNAVTQNFSLSGVDISDISAYRTSANENIKEISQSASGSSFSSQLPGNSVTTFVIGGTGSGKAPDEPDEDGNLAHYTFEQSSEGFTGRGGASVSQVKSDAYQGSGALSCTDRTATWNGASHSLNAKMCKPGEEYSFSAAVKYTSGSASDTFHFTLQYSDGGTTSYKKIATETVTKDDWVQLANTSFEIPAGATNCSIYIETASSTNDFYVDEMIIAPAGTTISGPKPVKYAIADVNGDGFTNAADLSLAKAGMIKGSFSASGAKKGADVTQDGDVTKDDITWFVKYLTKQETEIPPAPEKPVGQMRSIEEYTPVVEAQLSEKEKSGSTQRRNGVTYSEVKKYQYRSKKANKNKNVNVMLPPNYDESKKYPVLYVLHGFFENEDRMILTGNNPPIPTREIICNAWADGEAVDMIVVVPFVFTSATMNDATDFGDAGSNEGYDNFVDDIVDSLMPWVEENFSVATGRENTAVTGFSMGGRESLQIGMKYGDKFGYVGAICPAPGASGAWKWNSPEETPALVFITGGTNDNVVGLNTPQGYHNNFDKNGVPHIWHVVNGGNHGDDSICAHIYNFVRAVFKA
ncbi:MAG: carbohydrate binding domain-containing protein, partial [Oscillospiraceae bacterium]|nr:carbohydrate binding domain-containing protein [Oscillospiraceae bacterium]